VTARRSYKQTIIIGEPESCLRKLNEVPVSRSDVSAKIEQIQKGTDINKLVELYNLGS
jgi:hypothetical protein